VLDNSKVTAVYSVFTIRCQTVSWRKWNER